MKRFFVILGLVPCLAFGQPPPGSTKPMSMDANGNVLPAAVNGNVPNLPAGSKVGGVLIGTGSGLGDGDKGDVTVSSSGTVWSIDSGAVNFSELAGTAGLTQGGTGATTAAGARAAIGAGVVSATWGPPTPTYDGQIITSGDGSFGVTFNGTDFTDGLVLQNPIVYFKELSRGGFIGTITSGRILATSPTGSSNEHFFITNGLDNVLKIQNLSASAHSVVAYLAHDQSGGAAGIAASGIGNSGASAYYAGRYFLASNPPDGVGTPPDILISQEMENGSGYVSHARLMFDADPSSTRPITFYKWSNTTAFGASALTIDTINGRLGIGTDTPAEALDVTGNVKATGYKSSDGTAGATATTGGATFKNGLYTAGTITAGLASTDIDTFAELDAIVADASLAQLGAVQTWTAAQKYANDAWRILDTNSSHAMIFTIASDLTATRTMEFLPGDSSRTITFTGSPTLTDGTMAITNAGQTFTGTQVISAIDGGAAANDDIAIQGTSHATRTTSYVNLQPSGGGVTIGGATTRDYKLEILSGGFLVNDPGGAALRASTSHTAEIISTGSKTPLVMQGGTGAFEFWKDATPTRALSIGLANPLDAVLTNDVIISTYNGSAWGQVSRLYNAGGLVLGTTGSDPGLGNLTVSGGKINLGVQGSEPTPPSNMTVLYSFGDPAEGYWVDEAGNESLQTPHAKDAPAWLYDEIPGSEHVTKNVQRFVGTVKYVNHDRQGKLLELTSAERDALPIEKRRSVFTETIVEHNKRTGAKRTVLKWDDVQEIHKKERDAQISAWTEREKAADKAVNDFKKLKPADKAKATPPAEFKEPKPEPFKKKDMPVHLEARLKK